MPYKSEKIPLHASQDRRRKLTEEQKSEILRIYESGVCGMRPLAKQFGVSRTTIQIIVRPDRPPESSRESRTTGGTTDLPTRSGRDYERTPSLQTSLYVKGELKEVEENAYQRKTRDVYRLFVDYGQGWEHELDEFSLRGDSSETERVQRKLPAVPYEGQSWQRKD